MGGGISFPHHNIPLVTVIDHHIKIEIQNFFEVYKKLEKKPVSVHRWGGKEEAYKVINKAVEKFKLETKITPHE